ncbi:hypothetical protein O181_019440 [Austropuccinia psidii MF-1]|uniref:GAG-pre-integrase domain-containing protein n=1 Tax=Austropuccinia psidii MF-1 TaxID=1389203 RepID=A0A9Q3GV19_9BASI|nr:hypothetical protein [Austropuccinia psidii MF-1]
MLPTTLITTKDQSLWHRRLGHPGTLVLKRMGLPYEITTCSVCEINKPHKQPFNHQFNSAAQPLDCIHLDSIGPVVPASISGSTAPATAPCIEVIGPRHHTLVSSEIKNLNILPYPMRADALLSLADTTPCSFKGSLQSPEKDFWMVAIDKELLSMSNLKVWEVTEQQDHYNLVGTTWVFIMKRDHTNKVIEYKA